FTAQPRHVQEGRINEDLQRRYARGSTLVFPPLAETCRTADVLPIFYESLKGHRRAEDPQWQEPEHLDEVLLPDAQDWLHDVVARDRLSASLVADLTSKAPLRILGIP